MLQPVQFDSIPEVIDALFGSNQYLIVIVILNYLQFALSCILD